MALSININVNNSDISIKNSKTGAKKNIKSISAGNLNDMTDREFNISQKRKVARKQAMKLISDAWDKDNKAAQGIKDMESEKADIANINADLKSKLKDIDKSQKDLQELYGVHSESQEQKDLELLKKYQDNRNGVSNDKFSKEEIDRLKGNGIIKDEVIMQTGYCTYEPKHCEWSELLPYDQMLENVEKADIVITHGGPSSFIMPLQIGKIPIVVPRQKKYNEHVNNHQVEFATAVKERYGNIIVVKNIKNLEKAILKYDKITVKLTTSLENNNTRFNEKLENIVEDMFQ